MTHIPKDHEIETFSGRFVDLSNPQPDTIVLEDIAHGLSHTCRYNGQIEFYSVAEHAVAVSERLETLGYTREMCMIGLHHDDAEAYLGDVTRPLKSLLQPAYGVLTKRMEMTIAAALDLPMLVDPLGFSAVKDADNWALLREAKVLLPSMGEGWAGHGCNWDFDLDVLTESKPSNWGPSCLSPTDAEGLFLTRHWELIR